MVEPAFTPDEIWSAQTLRSNLDVPIQEAVESLNAQNPAEIIDNLTNRVETAENGVRYLIHGGDTPGYSTKEAVVIFNPFSNAATKHSLVTGRFFQEVTAYANITDSEGDLKPIIQIVSPGFKGSNIAFTDEERKLVEAGDLGPLASEMLKVVTQRGFGKAALCGFSQGGDIAASGIKSAFYSGLDVNGVAIADPARVEERTLKELGQDFRATSYVDMMDSKEATGLDIQKLSFGIGSIDLGRFVVGSFYGLNKSIKKGLSHDVLSADIGEGVVLHSGQIENVVVGYGTNSEIAKPENIEPIIDYRQKANLADTGILGIRIDRGDHTWGDRLGLIARLYLKAA